MLGLVWENIKSFAKNDRLVFTVFLLSQIIIVFFSILFYDFAYSFLVFQWSGSSTEVSISEVKLKVPEAREKVNGIMGEKKELFSSHIMVNSETGVGVRYPYQERGVAKGRYFTQEEYENGDKVIIYVKTPGSEELTGDVYILGGDEYKVIGIAEFSKLNKYNQIPYKCADTLVTVDTINLYIQTETNGKMLKELENYLLGVFPGAKITLPDQNDEMIARQMQGYEIVILLMGALVIFLIGYMFEYILYKRKYMYSVFRICGCKTSSGVACFLAECLAYGLVVCLLAGLLAALTAKKILKIFIYMDIPVFNNIVGVISVTLVYLLVMLVIFVPGIISFSRKMPNELKRGR